jgi:hypothetical protein
MYNSSIYTLNYTNTFKPKSFIFNMEANKGDRKVFRESPDEFIVQVVNASVDENQNMESYTLKIENVLSLDSISKPGEEFEVSKACKGGVPFGWYFKEIFDILHQGDLLELALASDAQEVSYKDITEPGLNHGYIIPTHIDEPRKSSEGIRRIGYFAWHSIYDNDTAGRNGERLVMYESRTDKGIETKTSNWFASLDAIYAIRLFQKRNRINVPLPRRILAIK